ncbi:flocculation protein FLO11-like isoform X2 [Daphnia magna]|nr:flocculation protein FLO11-like isoform X2 [Daphnia magna]
MSATERVAAVSKRYLKKKTRLAQMDTSIREHHSPDPGLSHFQDLPSTSGSFSVYPSPSKSFTPDAISPQLTRSSSSVNYARTTSKSPFKVTQLAGVGENQLEDMGATKRRLFMPCQSDRPSVLTYSDHRIERSSIRVQLSPKSKETATGSSVLPASSAALVISRQSSFSSKLSKTSSRLVPLKGVAKMTPMNTAESSQRLFSPSKINDDCNSVQLSRKSNGTAAMPSVLPAPSAVLPAPSAVLVTSRQSSLSSELSKTNCRLMPLKGVAKMTPKNITEASQRLPSKVNDDCNSAQLSRKSNGTAAVPSVLPAPSAVLPAPSAVLPAPSAVLVTSRQSSLSSELSKTNCRLMPLKGVAKMTPKNTTESSQRLPSKVNDDCNSVQLNRKSNGTAAMSSVLPAPSAVLPARSAVLPAPSAVLPAPSAVLPAPSAVLPAPSAVLVTSRQSSLSSELSKTNSHVVPLKGVAKMTSKNTAVR